MFLLFNEKGGQLGEKDILEKKLLMFNDVFADFVNGIMFDGKDVVKEDELVDLSGWSHYKGDDSKHRFQDRDVVKLWKKENVVISLIGIENQDIPDKNMVFRVLSYDGASYRTQLVEEESRKRKKNASIDGELQDIFPVITFVIYYGEEEWRHETTLHKRLNLGSALKHYVSDYSINLIDLKKLSEDDINKFKKDFKLIADYMVKGSKHKADRIDLNHPEEVSELILRLTGEELPFEVECEEGGKNREKFFEPMFERAEARGEARGRAEGREEGRAEGEARGRAEGEARGRAEGKTEGESCLARLISLLMSEGKNDKIKDVVENEVIRHGLYKEYGIQ